jgi:hypothetical protein
MKFLKSLVAAGALAAAALTTTTAADAATRVVVGNHHNRIVISKNHGHVVVKPVVRRAPIAVYGGWYADPGHYRSYAFYRANPRLRACFLVTQKGWHRGHRALISATMCYGKNGARFVVPTSRHFVRFL